LSFHLPNPEFAICNAESARGMQTCATLRALVRGSFIIHKHTDTSIFVALRYGFFRTMVEFDVVLLNGRVMDPETMLDKVSNVGIKGNRIAAITTDPSKFPRNDRYLASTEILRCLMKS